jgi:hypothetical protein
MLNQDMTLHEALEVQQLATDLEALRSDLRRTVIIRRSPPPAAADEGERGPDDAPDWPEAPGPPEEAPPEHRRPSERQSGGQQGEGRFLGRGVFGWAATRARFRRAILPVARLEKPEVQM